VQITDVTGGRGAAACCNGCGGRVGGQAAGISFDRVNGGAITGVRINVTINGFMYASDPLFTDQPPGDLHLLPVSPMIDAGSPSSPYANEPAPDGCQVNVGAYGNTSEAVSAPGANDCG